MLRYFRMGNRRTKIIWSVLTVVTIFGFLLGFNFLFGMDPGAHSGGTGNVLAMVGPDQVTRQELELALVQQRDQYKRQFGVEPADRDQKMLEAQAWRGLITEHLFAREAKRLGLQATDEQVKFMLHASPPPELAQLDAFQTSGKFDPQKYQQALRDPSFPWAQFEVRERQQLPVRLVEERLLSSVKLADPELRDAWRDRYEKVAGVLVQVPANMTAKPPAPATADLDRMYQKYQSRFWAGQRANVEVLAAPKTPSEEDKRQARQLAESVVQRARAGEDFAELAKTYSEGPGADKGGELPNTYQPAQLGPEMGPHIATLQAGQITDPIPQPGRYMILKVLDRVPQPGQPEPGLKLAQIVIEIHPNTQSLEEQYQKLVDVRKRAASLHDLGRAAVEKGFTTQKTGFFEATENPPALSSMPDAVDWAVHAAKGEVSQIYEGPDAFLLAEVVDRHAAGVKSREELEPVLRQLAELDARVTLAKPKADSVAAAMAGGATMEQASLAVGLTPSPVKEMTRSQPDPRLSASPEVAGAMFGAPVGKVLGPVRTVNGWLFARVDQRIAPSAAAYDSTAGQVRVSIVQGKQQTFYAGWVNALRERAHVRDLRSEGGR
jgi:peptidyl-prolyl cis-trans isomerase D